MSDRVYITRGRAESLETSQPVKYDRVILKKNDETTYYAPPGLTDAQWNAMTGKICEKDNPYATQAMANQILAALIAFDYMPFDARIRNDMSAQIGDPILIDGNYSIIASHDLEATALSMASVSAKGKEEEDELGYISAEARAFNRKLSQAAAELRVTTSEISARVTDVAGNVSTLSQTVGGIQTRVENVEGEYTTLSQTVSGLSIEIAGKIDGEDAQTLIDASIDGLSIAITSAEGTSRFQLKSGGATISTKTIDLSVDAVNISGTLTANQVATNIAQVNNILRIGSNSATGSQVTIAPNGNLSCTSSTLALRAVGSSTDLELSSYFGDVDIEADGDLTLSANGTNGQALRLWTICGSVYLSGNAPAPYFYPTPDDYIQLGYASHRWKSVWSTDGNIETSDERKKDILGNVDRYGEMFRRLDPIEYTWKNGDKSLRLGFSAQKVEKILGECGIDPESCAFLSKVKNEDTNDYEYGLNYGWLIPLLVDRVQKLEAKIYG